MSSSKGGIGRFSRKKAASTGTNNASTTTKPSAPTANARDKHQEPQPNSTFDDSSQVFEGSFHSNIVMESEDTFDFAGGDGNFDISMDIPCIQMPEFQPTNDDFGVNAMEASVPPPFKGRSVKNDDTTTPSGGDADNVVSTNTTNDDVDASSEKPSVSDETTLVTTAEDPDVFPEASVFPEAPAGTAADVPNSASDEASDVPLIAENIIQHQNPETQSAPTEQVATLDRIEGFLIEDNTLAVPSSGSDGAVESPHQKEPYAGLDIQGGGLDVADNGEEVPVESSTQKSVDVSDITPERAVTTNNPKGRVTHPKADKRASAPAPSKTPNHTVAQVETAPPPPSAKDPVVTPSPKTTTGVSGGANPGQTATTLQLDQGATGKVVTPETNDNPSTSSETYQRIQGLKTAFANRTTDGGDVNFEDAHNDFMEYLQASTEKVESGEKKLIDLEVELVTADSLLLMYQADLQDLLYSFDKINRKGLKALKKCGQHD